jgi:hypothetical protein
MLRASFLLGAARRGPVILGGIWQPFCRLQHGAGSVAEEIWATEIKLLSKEKVILETSLPSPRFCVC